MTIVEHLVEFRRRFIAVVICFFLVFCITLLFAGELYAYLTRGFNKPLLILGPNDILWIYINLASLMAFTVTLPFTTYQIWQFVKPGLRTMKRVPFCPIPSNFCLFRIGSCLWLLFRESSYLRSAFKTRRRAL